MKNLRDLDPHRVLIKEYGTLGDETCGAFVFPSPIDGQSLRIVASMEDGWDHVSVSRQSRVPNWPEMEFIKRKFFKDDETVMQLHLPPSEHINFHPFCLHLWRPQHVDIPRPPAWMVAPENKR